MLSVANATVGCAATIQSSGGRNAVTLACAATALWASLTNTGCAWSSERGATAVADPPPARAQSEEHSQAFSPSRRPDAAAAPAMATGPHASGRPAVASTGGLSHAQGSEARTSGRGKTCGCVGLMAETRATLAAEANVNASGRASAGAAARCRNARAPWESPSRSGSERPGRRSSHCRSRFELGLTSTGNISHVFEYISIPCSLLISHEVKFIHHFLSDPHPFRQWRRRGRRLHRRSSPLGFCLCIPCVAPPLASPFLLIFLLFFVVRHYVWRGRRRGGRHALWHECRPVRPAAGRIRRSRGDGADVGVCRRAGGDRPGQDYPRPKGTLSFRSLRGRGHSLGR